MKFDVFTINMKAFVVAQHFAQNAKNILFLASSEEEAITVAAQLKFFVPSNAVEAVLLLPSLDTVPYDRVSPSREILAQRAQIFSHLASHKNQKHILVTSAANMLYKIAPPEVFLKSRFHVKVREQITASKISEFLVQNGFCRASVATTAGEFSIRGEIVDVVLNDSVAYRINFDFDKVESIKQFNVETQISIPKSEFREISLDSSSEILFGKEEISNFKNNYLTYFGVNHTDLPVYHAITEGRKFPGYESLMPLFYDELVSLESFLPEVVVVYDYLSLQAMMECESSYHDFYEARIQSNKAGISAFYPALPPERSYYSVSQVKEKLASQECVSFAEDEGASDVPHSLISSTKAESIGYAAATFIDWIEHARDKKLTVILCASARSGAERFKQLAANDDLEVCEITNLCDAKKHAVNIAILSLQNGFTADKFMFITERDIFGKTFTGKPSISSKRQLKNILTELDALKPDELVVHRDHGIGRFLGVEILQVQGKPHDCLKILYAGEDKLYIPVENIETVKKYGHDEAELDKLGNVSWQKRKSKLKNRITDIAQKLIATAAERAVIKVEPIDWDLQLYDIFCKKFNYAETEDQLRTIEDIREDLAAGRLMDRLICGDVGFGKTEVAMRAAYMVAKAGAAQVAIIAPTTILAQQHYKRFLERFEGSGLRINKLSRLVAPKQAQLIKTEVESGDTDIVIGTHALFAKDVKFKNLRLLIVDEEQHFGVAQKERLKELKSAVHVLSMSATPIPRTLQMSMIGLKDLSLIATPPIDRLPVRTVVMPFDKIIVRDALMKEYFRGGRSFFVSPRIKDIEDAEKNLRTIVPELKYKVAHGGMPAAKVDQIMSEFYEGQFDILLSTTIIESGIDISSANTIIIYKADKLGLSQLYQLRGRVGRGKLRGYAYLLIDSKRSLPQAIKRLEIMQSINSLGAGFAIASHDMDLRGFGNLVGEEQSGHIKEVGTELYQEMLDNAIEEIQSSKGQVAGAEELAPTINLGLPVFIPESYIADASLRLGIYRRISNLISHDEIENFRDEIVDRFGPIPSEFNNLLDIIKVKHICVKLGIESLDSGDKGFLIKFHPHDFVASMVLRFVNNNPRHAKLRPDNKLAFLQDLNQTNILQAAEQMLLQMADLKSGMF